MTTTETPVRYRKTKAGEWVAYGPAASLKAGHTVAIRKADGTTESRIVERVGREFTADGTQMAYGYLAARTLPASRGTTSGYRARRGANGHTPGCPVNMGINACDCDE